MLAYSSTSDDLGEMPNLQPTKGSAIMVAHNSMFAY